MIIEVAENGRYIHIKYGCVVVCHKEEELGRIPIDTITALIISAQGATLSKTLLARLADNNIPVIICDANYLPVSIVTPVSAHYKQLAVVSAQIAAPQSLKKKMWADIIRAKLHNQWAVLKKHNPKAQKQLDRIALYRKKVRDGDPDNCEAHAARLYWSGLFGKTFVRDVEKEGINSFLNYSYAIVRASVVRAICASGLLPLLGIQHENKMNPFCLADDMMEPLRPLADDMVVSLAQENKTLELTPQNKRTLCGITEIKVSIGSKGVHFTPLTYLMAQSLSQSFSSGQPTLVTPTLPHT